MYSGMRLLPLKMKSSLRGLSTVTISDKQGELDVWINCYCSRGNSYYQETYKNP